MDTTGHIVISNLSKRQGGRDILNEVSFVARPGRITAFLGPNGAGKSSTLRILLGLDRSIGTATFGGRNYVSFAAPLKVVGATFDGIGGNPSRRVETHLKIIAQSNNISIRRVSEVLSVVGLSNRNKAKLGTLSVGEGQRLGLAAALLGDPQYLVLDEPTNGLDPTGIRWFRTFIRQQSDMGKTILLSSHILSEVEAVADDVIIINDGRIIAAGELQHVMSNLESLEDVFFSLTEGGRGDGGIF
ncbi:ATP-binding cassette domain-containing protein [Paenibacillus sp. YPG26]|uniref:ABC transporter ATP-binding protein n=1 Tax=Paenibacillus sp. YPG26 TaxID=2878915 RepID=UPI00203AE3E3|nr:ATP-binding cassette domain-containing protein [Paenibacillus sp. YPG26]USB31827.1 ATP-binding cassette domain-containing protein [Paenibacillus sp. YPG26]